MVNLEAEITYIGCLLKDDELIKDSTLLDKHFHDGFNRNVFNIIKKLDESNEPIDLAAVVVESKGRVDRNRLSQTINSVASTKVFKTLERHIFESWKLREADRIRRQSINELSDITKIVKELDELEDNHDDEYDHQQAIVRLYENIEKQTEGLSGIDTGFEDLNRYTDGYQKGDLIISAARPSVGKTAKMLNHAIAHCRNGGVCVIHSLEMGEELLNRRMLSAIGRIDGNKMRNPRAYFKDDDWSKLTNAMAQLSKYKMYIYDKSGQTPSYIKSKVREVKKKHPDEDILVMIDYLQLMRTDQKYESKNIEVGEITRTLKELARDEQVPVNVLSQLSRAVTQRQDKRPIMSDIRDSGSVEQDADVIEFLHRDDYQDYDAEESNTIEVIIAKQRNGSVGTVELVYLKEYNLMLDMDYRHDHS